MDKHGQTTYQLVQEPAGASPEPALHGASARLVLPTGHDLGGAAGSMPGVHCGAWDGEIVGKHRDFVGKS